MTQPENDTDQATRPEDDDPIALTGAPAAPPEGAEEGALFALEDEGDL